jgi:hypothetical protein
MEQFWPWVLLGLFPYDIAWQWKRGKRTLTVHAMFWSLALCWQEAKQEQEASCSWTVRVFLQRLHHEPPA